MVCRSKQRFDKPECAENISQAFVHSIFADFLIAFVDGGPAFAATSTQAPALQARPPRCLLRLASRKVQPVPAHRECGLGSLHTMGAHAVSHPLPRHLVFGAHSLGPVWRR